MMIMLKVLLVPACGEHGQHAPLVTNWNEFEPYYHTAEMTSAEYEMGKDCEWAEVITVCNWQGKLMIECELGD